MINAMEEMYLAFSKTKPLYIITQIKNPLFEPHVYF